MLIAVLGTTSCAQKTASTVADTDSADESVRARFPKNKPAQSAELLRILRSAGVKPNVDSLGNRIYQAFEVECRPLACRYSAQVNCLKKACLRQFNESDSEALSSLLFDLPVAQGGAGVATPYLACVVTPGAPESVSCHVAQLLDYPGP